MQRVPPGAIERVVRVVVDAVAEVQFLKITCRTGPCGGTTCGRVGRGRRAAPTSGAGDRHDSSDRDERADDLRMRV